jgi:uncharacterized repeat protein (TIGR02543 family)
MKKFLQEVFTYFWIPLIMGIVSYVFFQLRDVTLGITILVALSAIYTTVRLYFLHKKWWLLVILGVVVMASSGFFIIRSPSTALVINNSTASGSSVSVSGGTVTLTPQPQTNGRYTKGTKVTLTANPASGYDWKSWSGADVNTTNPTTVVMNGNKHVTVTFEQRASLIINNQTVIGSVVSFTEGSVTVNPVPGDDGKYTKGTEVTLTAKSTGGYDWKSWSGTSNDTANPVKITMSGNKQITATFEQRFTLIISNQLVIGSSVILPEGSVTVSPPPGDDDKYARGTVITLTAGPSTGYCWKIWSGTSGDTANPAKVTVSSDKHVVVTFEMRFFLTLNNQPVTGSSVNLTGGAVTIAPAPGADGRYAKDSDVLLTATPASGYRFGSWSGDSSGTNTALTLNVNAPKNISATFIKIFSLTASVSPSGGGSVSPASGIYDEGSNVNVTATPATGYRFDRWSGDVSGTSASLTLNMNAARNITANFVKAFTLSVLVSPTGGGTVSPGSGAYDESANVTLTATPAAGYRFNNWSGDVSGNATTLTVTMNADKTVTANFVKTYTLNVAVSPAAGGAVSINGGVYDSGATVTIAAAAATGYAFDHWEGDATGTTTSITITITGNKNITAVFKTSP